MSKNSGTDTSSKAMRFDEDAFDLAEHKKNALFYNSLDHGLCAAYIEMLIQNKTLAETISANARENRLIENDPATVLETQINIYSSLLNDL